MSALTQLMSVISGHLPKDASSRIIRDFYRVNDEEMLDTQGQIHLLMAIARNELPPGFVFGGHHESNGGQEQHSGHPTGRGQSGKQYPKFPGQYRKPQSEKGKKQGQHGQPWNWQQMAQQAPPTQPPAAMLALPPPGYPEGPRMISNQALETNRGSSQGGQRPDFTHSHPPRNQSEEDAHVNEIRGRDWEHGEQEGLSQRDVRVLARRFSDQCLKCGQYRVHFATNCPLYPGKMAYCSNCQWFHSGPCKSPKTNR